jgi:hypothetical protein
VALPPEAPAGKVGVSLLPAVPAKPEAASGARLDKAALDSPAQPEQLTKPEQLAKPERLVKPEPQAPEPLETDRARAVAQARAVRNRLQAAPEPQRAAQRVLLRAVPADWARGAPQARRLLARVEGTSAVPLEWVNRALVVTQVLPGRPEQVATLVRLARPARRLPAKATGRSWQPTSCSSATETSPAP